MDGHRHYRTCSFIANGLNQSVTANFVQQKRHLHVNTKINGIQLQGTSVFATSNPPGIDCGNAGFGHDACDTDFDYGTTVALTPFGDANTDFASWTSCSRVNQSICLVDMTANRTVVDNFNAVRTLSLTGTGNGAGTFTIAGSTPFTYLGNNTSASRRIFTGATNASATRTLVTPTAALGSRFSWVSSDFGCTGSAACTAIMNNNHSAIGRFLLNKHRIDVARRFNGSVTSVFPPGTFDCGTLGTDCTETFDFGTQVHLFASPDDGFIFDHWEGVTCTGGQSNASCAFKVPDTNLSIAPFYRAHSFVSVGKTGNGRGTLSATIAAGGLLKPSAPTCGPTCSALNFEAFGQGNNGRLVTLRATESLGSRFDGFTGSCLSNSSTCTFLPNNTNESVVATFTLRKFTVTVGNNVNGSVTNVNTLVDPIDCGGGPLSGHTDCTSTLDFGTPVILEATPLDGFIFTGWTTSPAGSVRMCAAMPTPRAASTSRTATPASRPATGARRSSTSPAWATAPGP